MFIYTCITLQLDEFEELYNLSHKKAVTRLLPLTPSKVSTPALAGLITECVLMTSATVLIL